MSGRVWRYGDDVDTDGLFPGKYTYTARTSEELARHALEDLDPTFAGAVRPGDVIVAGRNFGCGSSREQAVTCLRAVGITAVVAQSFARIFYRNAINHGIAALVCPDLVDAVAAGDRVAIAADLSTVSLDGRTYAVAPMSETVRAILDAGGLIPHARRRLADGRAR